MVVASLAVFFVAFQAITPLRERFLEGDVESVGGVSINVTGRDNVWSVVWQSGLTAPWIGHGARLEILWSSKGSGSVIRTTSTFGYSTTSGWWAFCSGSGDSWCCSGARSVHGGVPTWQGIAMPTFTSPLG